MQTITASDVSATYGNTDKSVDASVTDLATGGGEIGYAVKAGSENYIDIASDVKLTIKVVPSTDGKAYVIVTAAETQAYAQATKEVFVAIGGADVSKADVKFAKTSCVFDGKAREPKAKVTLSGGTLKDGTAYAVSYKGNAKVGIATATVTGKGNYNGAAKATFSIALAKARGLSTAGHPAIGALDASWRAVAGATSYELSWRADGSKWSSRSVKGTGVTFDGLRAGGLYEVRARAQGARVRQGLLCARRPSRSGRQKWQKGLNPFCQFPTTYDYSTPGS